MGKMIKDLRLSRGLTQQELADILGVSDKAVSKWETGGGYPDISMLPEIAKVFSVNIDYLLTGKEPVPMTLSEFEHLAKYGDELLYTSLKSKNHLFSVYNEYGKELMDYILQYENTKIFDKLASEGKFSSWIQNTESRQVTDHDILYLMIISNNKVLLEKYGRKLRINANKPTKDVDKLIHTLLTDNRVLKETKEYILGISSRIANNEYLNIFLIELVKTNDKQYISSLIDQIVKNNETILKQFNEQERLNPQHTQMIRKIRNYDGGFYIEDLLSLRFVIIKKEVFDISLEYKQYDLLRMLNHINQLVPNNHIYLMNEKEIEVAIINDDTSLNKTQNAKKLVMAGGLLDVEKLILFDDYKLFVEMIDKPAYIQEVLLDAIDKEDYKELLSIALKYKEVCPWLPEATLSFSKSKILEINNRKDNIRSLKTKEYWKELKIKSVKFENIIHSKHIEFFKLALINDSKHLDWALENVDPTQFEIINFLLDNGAKLYTHVKINNDFVKSIDEVDEIGTEILRKKIKDIIGG